MKKNEKAPGGKSLNKGNNRLGKIAGVSLQKYFKKAVKSSIQPGLLR